MNKLALIPNSFGIFLAPIWLVVEHFIQLKLLLSVSVQSCSLPQAGYWIVFFTVVKPL